MLAVRARHTPWRERPNRSGPLCLAISCLTLLAAPEVRAQADPDLLAALTDSNSKVRVRAAVVIGKKKLREAAPALRAALGDESDAVRAAAARALGEVGDQSARSVLAGLLGHASEAVRKSATRGLELLDTYLGGTRKYLLAVDEPVLPPGTSKDHGRRLLASVKAELERHPTVVPAAGEERALAQGGLVEHLRARKLTGIRIQPRLVKLQSSASGVICKVSVMSVTMPANRMEFAGNGEGEAEADGELEPDERTELEVQLIEAAAQAASEEVGGFLTRRTGP
jgi:hypothetical protein